MGVLQTTVAEIVTVKEHQGRLISDFRVAGTDVFQLERIQLCHSFGVLGMPVL